MSDIETIKNLEKILQKTQWQSFAENTSAAEESLANLLKYSYGNVPFYQDYYKAHVARKPKWERIAKDLRSLPILSRSTIQNSYHKIVSNHLPATHGNTYEQETSGSTGRPLKTLGTGLTKLFYYALMLREHSWHKRDFQKKLMSISWLKKDTAMAPIGYAQPTWGAPVDQCKNTGPGVMMNIASSTATQVEGILYHKPQIIITYPSQAYALAQYVRNHQIDMSFLEEIRTTGETFTDFYKNTILEVWNHIKIADIYSCVEIGNIASQCGEHGNYHVNTEHIYCEIVNDKNEPCDIYEPGKILITSLANYATPLIRYEIGDYGMWGEPCACGRGLPVIQKILGRTRNRLILPNGESRFPYLGEREERKKITDDVLKFQFVQKSFHEIEYKVVVKKPLSVIQENALKEYFKNVFEVSCNITITYHDDIPLSPTGKYEEFISCL